MARSLIRGNAAGIVLSAVGGLVWSLMRPPVAGSSAVVNPAPHLWKVIRSGAISHDGSYNGRIGFGGSGYTIDLNQMPTHFNVDTNPTNLLYYKPLGGRQYRSTGGFLYPSNIISGSPVYGYIGPMPMSPASVPYIFTQPASPPVVQPTPAPRPPWMPADDPLPFAPQPSPVPRPARQPRPMEVPEFAPQRGPAPFRRPAPVPERSPEVVPGRMPGWRHVQGVEVRPDGTVRPINRPAAASALQRPPRAAERERKGVTSNATIRAVKAGLSAFTETTEFIDAIHDALPWKYQSRSMMPWDKAAAILANLSHLDLTKAAVNIAANQVEDAVIGAVGKRLGDTSRDLGLTVGVQTGTANRNATAGIGPLF